MKLAVPLRKISSYYLYFYLCDANIFYFFLQVYELSHL